MAVSHVMAEISGSFNICKCTLCGEMLKLPPVCSYWIQSCDENPARNFLFFIIILMTIFMAYEKYIMPKFLSKTSVLIYTHSSVYESAYFLMVFHQHRVSNDFNVSVCYKYTKVHTQVFNADSLMAVQNRRRCTLHKCHHTTVKKFQWIHTCRRGRESRPHCEVRRACVPRCR